ncbi:alpha/beta hydrolase fold domain-containing protein [Escherichia coli]
MALEKGIAELVEKFIAAVAPHRVKALRSAGRVISPALSLRGETETRVDIQTIELRYDLTIGVAAECPRLHFTIIYYYGGCFVSGGFATHDNQLRQLAYYGQCRVIAVQYRLAPDILSPPPMMMRNEVQK